MAAKKPTRKKPRTPKPPKAIIELMPDAAYITITNANPKNVRVPAAMKFLKGLGCRIEEPDDTTIILRFKNAKAARSAFGKMFIGDESREISDPLIGDDKVVPYNHDFNDQKGMGAFAEQVARHTDAAPAGRRFAPTPRAKGRGHRVRKGADAARERTRERARTPRANRAGGFATMPRD